ncbi:hypothetical protein PR048_027913, partial [Dryococelus australis]
MSHRDRFRHVLKAVTHFVFASSCATENCRKYWSHGGVVVKLLTSHLGEHGSIPDFRRWESCQTMPLFPPSVHSDAAPYSFVSPSSAQDLDVKSPKCFSLDSVGIRHVPVRMKSVTSSAVASTSRCCRRIQVTPHYSECSAEVWSHCAPRPFCDPPPPLNLCTLREFAALTPGSRAAPFTSSCKASFTRCKMSAKLARDADLAQDCPALGGRGSVVVRLLASHLGETGFISGGVAPGFSRVGIVSDDAAGRRGFPRGSLVFLALAFLHCSILSLTSSASSLKTSILKLLKYLHSTPRIRVSVPVGRSTGRFCLRHPQVMPIKCHGLLSRTIFVFGARCCGSDEGDNAAPIKCAVAPMCKAPNLLAVFSSYCVYLRDFRLVLGGESHASRSHLVGIKAHCGCNGKSMSKLRALARAVAESSSWRAWHTRASICRTCADDYARQMPAGDTHRENTSSHLHSGSSLVLVASVRRKMCAFFFEQCMLGCGHRSGSAVTAVRTLCLVRLAPIPGDLSVVGSSLRWKLEPHFCKSEKARRETRKTIPELTTSTNLVSVQQHTLRDPATNDISRAGNTETKRKLKRA